MAMFKCKMCGGDLNVTEETKIIECEYCGSTQTVPDGNDEKKAKLFNRANRLRMDNEFDKAAGVYESIVSEFPEDSEGYWGLVLCAYGIEYVDDIKTGKKIPTCHRTLTSSVMDNDNFVQACENADAVARGIYREEAKAIDKLQQQIISVVESEEPYDVFICYKETDDITKARTEDSLIAQDIYTELIKEGYKVFFSRVTLRGKAGTEYEPYIYAALKSAKVMIAIGTKYDYYDAVWVKNEWSRYLAMMADDSSKHLIPCFKNLDAYDIPGEFKNLQALDMGEVTFFKNLTDNVERFIPKPKTVVQNEIIKKEIINTIHTETAAPGYEPLLKRAYIFLGERNYKSAEEYCERVLDLDPENAMAYLGKALCDLKIVSKESLKYCDKPLRNNSHFRKALKYADDELKKELEGYADRAEEAYKNRTNEGKYSKAGSLMKDGNYAEAAQLFKEISDYKDSASLHKECLEKAEYSAKKKTYDDAMELIKKDTEQSLNDAMVLLEKIKGFEDADKKINECKTRMVSLKAEMEEKKKEQERLDELVQQQKQQAAKRRKKILIACAGGLVAIVAAILIVTKIVIPASNYSKGEEFMAQEDYVSAITHFQKASKYKDSRLKIMECMDKGKLNSSIAVDDGYLVGLCSDGTVQYARESFKGARDVSSWSNVVKVATGDGTMIAGVTKDGKVLLEGADKSWAHTVKQWKNVVDIGIGNGYIIGVKDDGSLYHAGKTPYGMDKVTEWDNVSSISVGYDYIVCLKKDGTVIARGENDDGQCNVDGWKNVKAVSAGFNMTAALTQDGTVLATGHSVKEGDFDGWKNIVEISAGYGGILGLTADGRVLYHNEKGYDIDTEIENAVSVSQGGDANAILCADGTVKRWPAGSPEWENIVAVKACEDYIIGIKADGTAVSMNSTIKLDNFDIIK